MSDKQYWKLFYETDKNKKLENSDFCNFVMDYFKNNTDVKNILDAGCGDGRDGLFISTKYNVVGVDNNGFGLDNTETFKFFNDDFITIDKSNFDLIYSRFTFHSITNEDHDIFLETIQKNTYLAIEARSIKGIEDNVYYGKEHYRNYIDLIYLRNILVKHNFEIFFIKEDIDMAIYKTENPICIRVICKKL
jgi:SAM-dependent methyltransferase